MVYLSCGGLYALSQFLSLRLSTEHHKTFHVPKTDPSSHQRQDCIQLSDQQFGKSKGKMSSIIPFLAKETDSHNWWHKTLRQAHILRVSIRTSPSEVLVSRGIASHLLQASFFSVPTAKQTRKRPEDRLYNKVSASTEEIMSFYLTSCSDNNQEAQKYQSPEGWILGI